MKKLFFLFTLLIISTQLLNAKTLFEQINELLNAQVNFNVTEEQILKEKYDVLIKDVVSEFKMTIQLPTGQQQFIKRWQELYKRLNFKLTLILLLHRYYTEFLDRIAKDKKPHFRKQADVKIDENDKLILGETNANNFIGYMNTTVARDMQLSLMNDLPKINKKLTDEEKSNKEELSKIYNFYLNALIKFLEIQSTYFYTEEQKIQKYDALHEELIKFKPGENFFSRTRLMDNIELEQGKFSMRGYIIPQEGEKFNSFIEEIEKELRVIEHDTTLTLQAKSETLKKFIKNIHEKLFQELDQLQITRLEVLENKIATYFKERVEEELETLRKEKLEQGNYTEIKDKLIKLHDDVKSFVQLLSPKEKSEFNDLLKDIENQVPKQLSTRPFDIDLAKLEYELRILRALL